MEEQNKTEQATPYKLSEAKKQGQVAKSLDCVSLFVVAGLLLALLTCTRGWWQLAELSRQLLESAPRTQLDGQTVPVIAARLASMGLQVLLPLAGIGVLCAVLGNVVQTGPIFSMTALQPKFARLNPAAGLKRLFNLKPLIEGMKSVLKLLFIGSILLLFFGSLWPEIPGLVSQSLERQLQWLAQHVTALLFRLLLALLVVASLDAALTRWQFARQMMMSKREVKEEIKRREGDPLLRAKIRELQRATLQQSRAMQRVPEADVLITNPQHLAVALRYDRNAMHAPQVIAKGADRWAQQMRALAEQHGVPQFERRPLARLLFRRGALGGAIPVEAFRDVAYIYAALAQRQRGDGRYEHAS